MTDPHRLPRSVTPEAYRLDLRADLDSSTFDGAVTVTLTVHEPVTDFACHALDLEILDVSLDTGDGPTPVRWSLHADTERLVITPPQPLAGGAAELHITYRGRIGDGLVGFYRSTYVDDGVDVPIAVTQFEAPHARRAFPCWDEPEFKARFSLRLTVRSDLLAVANGAEIGRTDLGDGWTEVRFAETIPMSTYLVAWAIGRLEATDAVVVRGIPIRIVHRPGQGHLTSLALTAAAHAVAWFEDHFDIPFPGGKLDMVAVPDFAFGAMENLGCITYREVLLLADPATVTPREREDIALVVAHEIAHMWFGDLVTMQWWDGIWLNEAFATHLELLCADDHAPDLDVWTGFGLGRAPAFDVDSVGSTRPIHYRVETPEDAEGMFDVLTYEKGASVLRMVEQHIGADVWRDGTRRYLRRHLYGNTTATDLWDALGEASGAPVAPILESWITQGGHPALHVEPTTSGVVVTQERYRPLGSDTPPALWQVPMIVTASVAGRSERHVVLLTAPTLELDLGGRPDWANVNTGGIGFYRSRYSLELQTALAARAGELTPLERFVLLDDAWAAVRSGHGDLGSLRGVMAAVAGDDVAVWRLTSEILRVISGMPTPSHSAADIVSEIVGDRWQEVAGTPADAEVSAMMLRLAALPGENLRARSLGLSTAHSVLDDTGPPELPADLAAAALDIAGAIGDATMRDRLWSAFREATTPQFELRALRAMAQTGNAELQLDLLDRCLTDIRPQNIGTVVATALRHPHIGDGAWRWVAAHWDELTERVPAGALPRMMAGVSTISDPATANEIATFFEAHPLPVGELTMQQHLDLLRAHQALISTSP